MSAFEYTEKIRGKLSTLTQARGSGEGRKQGRKEVDSNRLRIPERFRKNCPFNNAHLCVFHLFI